MISVWNLVWIIPASVFFGYAICGLLTMNGRCEK